MVVLDKFVQDPDRSVGAFAIGLGKESAIIDVARRPNEFDVAKMGTDHLHRTAQNEFPGNSYARLRRRRRPRPASPKPNSERLIGSGTSVPSVRAATSTLPPKMPTSGPVDR